MLAWLGEWLQSIVVVVLLAVVVELVLPSSKMLRYTRLVIGLVLLLTMLNPIFQLFQIDFQQKLNASFQQWEKEIGSRQSSSVSLQKITNDAQKLQQQREGAALEVTKTSLEQAILQQLHTSSTAKVDDVDVQLGWTEGREQQLYIERIVVAIAIHEEKLHDNDIEVVAPIELEPISIPVINLNPSSINTAPTNEQPEDRPLDGKTEAQHNEHFQKLAQEITSIIAAGWNVNRNQIFVQASN